MDRVEASAVVRVAVGRVVVPVDSAKPIVRAIVLVAAPTDRTVHVRVDEVSIGCAD